MWNHGCDATKRFYLPFGQLLFVRQLGLLFPRVMPCLSVFEGLDDDLLMLTSTNRPFQNPVSGPFIYHFIPTAWTAVENMPPYCGSSKHSSSPYPYYTSLIDWAWHHPSHHIATGCRASKYAPGYWIRKCIN